jgi:ubiquitin-protein ligase
MNYCKKMANFRRIVKDLASLQEPERAKEGIYVRTINDSINRIYMMLVGPEDTPYEGCLFFFTIDPAMQFHSTKEEDQHKQYPYNPPRVLFYSPYSIRCHPNLYQPGSCGIREGGKVCLSILGTWSGPSWVPMMTFLTIAQTILSILDNEPLRNEPGFANGKNPEVPLYTQYVQYVCLRETIEQVIKPVFLESLVSSEKTEKTETSFKEIFKEEILNYYLQNKEKYQSLLKKRAMEYDEEIIPLGGCYGNSSYVGKNYNYNDILEKLL